MKAKPGSRRGLELDERNGRGRGRSGWTRWTGPLRCLTPDGVVDGDDSWVYVLPVGPVDPSQVLVCDWRRGSLW